MSKYLCILAALFAGILFYFLATRAGDLDEPTSDEQFEAPPGSIYQTPQKSSQSPQQLSPKIPKEVAQRQLEINSRPRVFLYAGPRTATETPEEYKYRKLFLADFEKTRIRAQLSDQQVQTILLALYDYTHNYRAERESRLAAIAQEDEQEDEAYVLEDEEARRPRSAIEEKHSRVFGALEPWQALIFREETCQFCLLRANLAWEAFQLADNS